jgi:hypothetical protein
VEALVFAVGPFHDPAVQWTAKRTAEGLCLTIGSEHDRILVVFSTEEMQQFVAQYADSQLSAAASTHAGHTTRSPAAEGPPDPAAPAPDRACRARS